VVLIAEGLLILHVKNMRIHFQFQQVMALYKLGPFFRHTVLTVDSGSDNSI